MCIAGLIYISPVHQPHASQLSVRPAKGHTVLYWPSGNNGDWLECTLKRDTHDSQTLGGGGFMSVPNILLLLLPRFEIHCKTIVGRDETDSGCNVQLDCADTDGVENITTRRRSVEELLHILKNDVTRVITFSNAEMEVSVAITLNIRWKHFLCLGC